MMEIGDIKRLGNFDWQVLEIVGGRALLLSKKVVEVRQFADHEFSLTSTNGWRESALRRYLNGEFLDSLGTAKDAICQTVVQNDNNSWYGSAGGIETADKVFLLSISEVVRLFGDSGQLANRPTSATSWINDEYNDRRIARQDNGEPFWWWLRSPGDMAHRAAFVNSMGCICVDGYDTDSMRAPGGVRPAVWVMADALL